MLDVAVRAAEELASYCTMCWRIFWEPLEAPALPRPVRLNLAFASGSAMASSPLHTIYRDPYDLWIKLRGPFVCSTARQAELTEDSDARCKQLP